VAKGKQEGSAGSEIQHCSRSIALRLKKGAAICGLPDYGCFEHYPLEYNECFAFCGTSLDKKACGP
jgi:hypothetical protein